MANFRGYGDDALAERKSIRTNETSRMGIKSSAATAGAANATARAGQRMRANEAEASLAEGARQADMKDARAKEGAALDQKNVDANLDIKMQAETRQQRQLAINEETYNGLQANNAKMKQAQELMTSRDTAMRIGMYRMAMESEDGHVPQFAINQWNNMHGVAMGEPGSMGQLFSIKDGNKARMGLGVLEYGKDGEEIQTVLDPMAIYGEIASAMPAKEGIEWLTKRIEANQSKGNDRESAAASVQLNRLKELEGAAKALELASGAKDNAALAEPGTKRTDSKLWPGQTFEPTGDKEEYDTQTALAQESGDLAKGLINGSGKSVAPAPADRSAATKSMSPKAFAIHQEIMAKVEALPEKDRPAAYAKLTKAAKEKYNSAQSTDESTVVEKGVPSPINDKKWKFPTKHPNVDNGDGSKSNVILGGAYEYELVPGGSKTKAIVYPSMVDGKKLSEDEAKTLTANYIKKGAVYPTFNTMADADAWASANHAKFGEDGSMSNTPKDTDTPPPTDTKALEGEKKRRLENAKPVEIEEEEPSRTKDQKEADPKMKPSEKKYEDAGLVYRRYDGLGPNAQEKYKKYGWFKKSHNIDNADVIDNPEEEYENWLKQQERKRKQDELAKARSAANTSQVSRTGSMSIFNK